MYDVYTARKKTRIAGWARLEKAVEYAIGEGKNLCYVHYRATDDDVMRLEKLGYEVKVDGAGVTWIYWFETKELTT